MALTSKVSLITSSTNGIGLATAHVLAEQGVNLILHGLASDTDIKKKSQLRLTLVFLNR